MSEQRHVVVYSNELSHYGVPDMKWHHRRWQTINGGLTPAGYKHYKEMYGWGDGKKKKTTSSGPKVKRAASVQNTESKPVDNITEDQTKVTINGSNIDSVKVSDLKKAKVTIDGMALVKSLLDTASIASAFIPAIGPLAVAGMRLASSLLGIIPKIKSGDFKGRTAISAVLNTGSVASALVNTINPMIGTGMKLVAQMLETSKAVKVATG